MSTRKTENKPVKPNIFYVLEPKVDENNQFQICHATIPGKPNYTLVRQILNSNVQENNIKKARRYKFLENNNYLTINDTFCPSEEKFQSFWRDQISNKKLFNINDVNSRLNQKYDEYGLLLPYCEQCNEYCIEFYIQSLRLEREASAHISGTLLGPQSVNILGHWYDFKEIEKKSPIYIRALDQTYLKLLNERYDLKTILPMEKLLDHDGYIDIQKEELKKLEADLTVENLLPPPLIPWDSEISFRTFLSFQSNLARFSFDEGKNLKLKNFHQFLSMNESSKEYFKTFLELELNSIPENQFNDLFFEDLITKYWFDFIGLSMMFLPKILCNLLSSEDILYIPMHKNMPTNKILSRLYEDINPRKTFPTKIIVLNNENNVTDKNFWFMIFEWTWRVDKQEPAEWDTYFFTNDPKSKEIQKQHARLGMEFARLNLPWSPLNIQKIDHELPFQRMPSFFAESRTDEMLIQRNLMFVWICILFAADIKIKLNDRLQWIMKENEFNIKQNYATFLDPTLLTSKQNHDILFSLIDKVKKELLKGGPVQEKKVQVEVEETTEPTEQEEPTEKEVEVQRQETEEVEVSKEQKEPVQEKQNVVERKKEKPEENFISQFNKLKLRFVADLNFNSKDPIKIKEFLTLIEKTFLPLFISIFPRTAPIFLIKPGKEWNIIYPNFTEVKIKAGGSGCVLLNVMIRADKNNVLFSQVLKLIPLPQSPSFKRIFLMFDNVIREFYIQYFLSYQLKSQMIPKVNQIGFVEKLHDLKPTFTSEFLAKLKKECRHSTGMFKEGKYNPETQMHFLYVQESISSSSSLSSQIKYQHDNRSRKYVIIHNINPAQTILFWQQILIQILFFIRIFELSKISHNDLNPGNILISKKPIKYEVKNAKEEKEFDFKNSLVIPTNSSTQKDWTLRTSFQVHVIDFGLSQKWDHPLESWKHPHHLYSKFRAFLDFPFLNLTTRPSTNASKWIKNPDIWQFGLILMESSTLIDNTDDNRKVSSSILTAFRHEQRIATFLRTLTTEKKKNGNL